MVKFARRRRFTRRRRSFKKKRMQNPWKGRRPRGTRGLAARAYTMARMVGAPEVKTRYTEVGAINILDTGNVSPLSAIPEGTDSDERVGRKIRVLSVAIHFGAEFLFNSPSDTEFRLLLIQMHVTNTPTLTNMFGVAQPNIRSFFSRDYSTQFRVIRDITFVFSKQYSAEDNRDRHLERRYYIKGPLSQRYSGPLATDHQEGTYFIVLYSNLGASWPLASYRIKTRYTDV